MEGDGKGRGTTYPLDKVIQNDIVNDVIRGVYEKGSMIPNQETLSRKYKVSRTTVRKATDELIRNGILQAVRGKGTFVVDTGENVHQIFRSTLCEEAKKVRDHLTSRTITIQTLSCTAAIAKRLNIKNGDPVVYLERVRLLRGQPYAFQSSYLNGRYVERVSFSKERLDQGSLFQLLEEQAGLVPSFQDEEYRAVGCPGQVAVYLDAEPHSPVIMIFRTVYAMDGRTMEYCEEYECTDFKGIHVRTYARAEYQ